MVCASSRLLLMMWYYWNPASTYQLPSRFGMNVIGDFPVSPVENTPALLAAQGVKTDAPQPVAPLFQYVVGPTVTQVGAVKTTGMPLLLSSSVGTKPSSTSKVPPALPRTTVEGPETAQNSLA